MKIWVDVEQILFSGTQIYFLCWFRNHKLVRLVDSDTEIYQDYITKKKIFVVRYKTLFFLKWFVRWFLDFNILIEDEPRRERYFAEES